MVWWLRLGVVVITTAQLHSTKSEVRFCAGSNPARGVLEIRVSEDIWQWSRLEIKLNAFHRSTIPQKQFISIIIIKIGCMSLDTPSNYCVNVLKFRVREHGMPCALEMYSNGGSKRGHVESSPSTKKNIFPLPQSLWLPNFKVR